MITNSIQQIYNTTALSAASAASNAQAVNDLSSSGNSASSSSTTVKISEEAQALLAASQASSTPNVSGSSPISLADIANKYDVQNMTANQMSSMATDLYHAGAISELDAATLSFQPMNTSINSQIGLNTGGNQNTPKNFLTQWQSTYQYDKSVSNTKNYAFDEQVVNILSNLASMRASGAAQASTASSGTA